MSFHIVGCIFNNTYQISQFEDVKFEAASILSEFYCQQVCTSMLSSSSLFVKKKTMLGQTFAEMHLFILLGFARSDVILTAVPLSTPESRASLVFRTQR